MLRGTVRRQVVAGLQGRMLLLVAPIAIVALAGVAPAGAVPTTLRVSVDAQGGDANGASYTASISEDGRYVAFVSAASDLVPNDGNGKQDVFVRDLVAGTTVRASVARNGGNPNGPSLQPSISADGRYVAFRSKASNLVRGDTNGQFDVFVRDVMAGRTAAASLDMNGGPSNGDNSYPSLSANGAFVTFRSESSDLVPGDQNTVADIFVRNLVARTTVRASVDVAGGDANNEAGLHATVSGEGRYVAFPSRASDLVPGDGNQRSDVFVRDLMAGVTSRISVDTLGGDANDDSFWPSFSDDGRYVAFESNATDLVGDDTNGVSDIFLWNKATGSNTRISVGPQGEQATGGQSVHPSISADGGYVAFQSGATNLVAADANLLPDAFVRDISLDTTTRVSVNLQGGDPNGYSLFPSVSSSNPSVAFQSLASNLVSNDMNGSPDVFVRTLS
jgi:Tol biopolymer transport system component